MEREIALMLAKLFAQENEAGHLLFTFTRNEIPTLKLGQAIVVEVKWDNRARANLFPEFDFAGVVGVPV